MVQGLPKSGWKASSVEALSIFGGTGLFMTLDYD